MPLVGSRKIMDKKTIEACETIVKIWDKKELWLHITDLEFAKAIAECRKAVQESKKQPT